MSSAVGAYVGDLGSYDVNMGSYDVDMGVYPGKDFLCTSAAISARRSARRKRSVGFFLPCIGLSEVPSKKRRKHSRCSPQLTQRKKLQVQVQVHSLTTRSRELCKRRMRMLSEKWKWTKPRTKPRTKLEVPSKKRQRQDKTSRELCETREKVCDMRMRMLSGREEKSKKNPASSSATQDKT